MRVERFNIREVEGYPFKATDEAKHEYSVYRGHPLINPYFESNRLIKYFYWKKIRIITGFEEFDPGSRVMDVGCGPGIFLPTLAGNFADVIALDINEDDLRIAQTICDCLQLENVRVMQSDISHLDLPAASIDIAFSMDALEHIPEIDTALDKLHEIVRPGGRLVISAPTENRINDFSRRIMGYEKPKTHFHDSRQIAELVASGGRFRLLRRTTPFRLPRVLSVVEMFLYQRQP